MFKEFGHGACNAWFGPAKVFVDLQQAFPGKVGTNIGRGKRDTQESHRGRAKQAGVPAGRPVFHPGTEFSLWKVGQGGKNLKKKRDGPVGADQAGRGRKNTSIPAGMMIPEVVRDRAEKIKKNKRFTIVYRFYNTLPDNGMRKVRQGR